MENQNYYKKEIVTKVGKLSLIGSDKGLYAVLWETDKPTRVKLPQNIQIQNDYPLFLETERQLQEYFSGNRTEFSVPLDLEYGTTFQKNAWLALTKIPYGEVRSYADQAKVVNNPKAIRAIGTANGKNPLSIIVPCHRVITSNGTLGGFAGGLKIKQFLLDLERKHS